MTSERDQLLTEWANDAGQGIAVAMGLLLAERDALRARLDEGHEMERLLEESSLGAPDAEVLREQVPPETVHAISLAIRANMDLADALDALESMVEQYLGVGDGKMDHMFMTAGEEACDVLVRLRPDKWRATNIGVERVGDG